MLGCSHVQRSPTDCGVSECDHEDSIMGAVASGKNGLYGHNLT